MKILTLTALVLCAANLAFAEEKSTAAPHDDAHMQMHASMAKAHQQAADCLKSGKPEEECSKEFHAVADKNGGESCGGGMHHKMKHKNK